MSVTVSNSGYEPVNCMLFVILDVYGTLFFWPDWDDFGCREIVLEAMIEEVYEIIPEFIWPENVGYASDIIFYSGLTDIEISQLLGHFSYWDFGWYE